MRLDLHGYTIHKGWEHFKTYINLAYYNDVRKITVITGQGAMMKEFPTWAKNHDKIREFSQTPNNLGSFTVTLKKKG